jgi:hypothetical protein
MRTLARTVAASGVVSAMAIGTTAPVRRRVSTLMGMAFTSTLALIGTIMTVTTAADGTLGTAARPATQYRVEIARPTEAHRVGAINAKFSALNAIEAVPVRGGLSYFK